MSSPAQPARRRSAARRLPSLPVPRRVAAWIVGGYAVVAYLASSATLLYLAGFLVDVAVPRSVDRPVPVPVPGAAASLGRDLALVLLFGASHSVLARRPVKRLLARMLPASAERSTYVLVAAATLFAVMWWWTPLTGTIWQATGLLRGVALTVNAAGWVLALAATFAVSHTDLFGLRQAGAAVTGRPYTPHALDRSGLHRRMRHPLMTGLLVVVWATPAMTSGHLALSAALTTYLLAGVALEERDLTAEHGSAYAAYRRSTPAFVPSVRLPRPGSGEERAGAGRRSADR